jgi:xylulokinase
MGYAAIEELTGEPVDELVAIGGGARSPLWRQIIADATGKRVEVSATVEASCLGAGMLAAHAAGWYPTIEAAARAMQGAIGTTAEPDAERARTYGRLLPIYRDVYPAMQATFARLAAFRSMTEAP